jgi:antitoxin component YwqK of YwqJK toxin-antitoxin module
MINEVKGVVKPSEVEYGYDEDAKELAWIYKNGVHKGKRINGVVEYRWAKGGVRERIPIEDGKIHGTEEVFYEDGGLKERMEWVRGVREGLEEKFSERIGNLVLSRWWKNNDKHGKCERLGYLRVKTTTWYWEGFEVKEPEWNRREMDRVLREVVEEELE